MKDITKEDVIKKKQERFLRDMDVVEKLNIFIKIGATGMAIGIVMGFIDYNKGEELDMSLGILIVSWIVFIIPKVWADNLNKKYNN